MREWQPSPEQLLQDHGCLAMIASPANMAMPASMLLVDSGSSEHSCPVSWREECGLQPLTRPLQLMTATGVAIHCAGTRVVPFELFDRTRSNIKFMVLETTTPVLSVGRLQQSGFQLYIGKSATLRKAGHRWTLTKIGNLYYLPIFPLERTSIPLALPDSRQAGQAISATAHHSLQSTEETESGQPSVAVSSSSSPGPGLTPSSQPAAREQNDMDPIEWARARFEELTVFVDRLALTAHQSADAMPRPGFMLRALFTLGFNSSFLKKAQTALKKSFSQRSSMDHEVVRQLTAAVSSKGGEFEAILQKHDGGDRAALETQTIPLLEAYQEYLDIEGAQLFDEPHHELEVDTDDPSEHPSIEELLRTPSPLAEPSQSEG